MIGLYPCTHVAGLKFLKHALGARKNKFISEKLLKMAEFLLKNNMFEFNGTVSILVSNLTMNQVKKAYIS